jgi:hypothetical protein
VRGFGSLDSESKGWNFRFDRWNWGTVKDLGGVIRWGMDTSKVRAHAEQIRALPDSDQQALAQEALPVLLSARAGLEALNRALTTLSDRELDSLFERARAQSDLPETAAAALIGEAVFAVRAQSRS